MSKVADFPSEKSSVHHLQNTLSVLSTARPSFLEVSVTKAGKNVDHLDGRCTPFFIEASADPFSLYHSLRRIFVGAIGVRKMQAILEEIGAHGFFSDHICHKVAEFLRTGTIIFRQEAQFPPEVIRRPEKNVYFATSFTMVATKIFLQSHRLLCADCDGDPVYVIEQAQRLDRDSCKIWRSLSSRTVCI